MPEVESSVRDLKAWECVPCNIAWCREPTASTSRSIYSPVLYGRYLLEAAEPVSHVGYLSILLHGTSETYLGTFNFVVLLGTAVQKTSLWSFGNGNVTANIQLLFCFSKSYWSPEKKRSIFHSSLFNRCSSLKVVLFARAQDAPSLSLKALFNVPLLCY